MEAKEYNLDTADHSFKVKAYWLDQVNDFNEQ